MNRAIAYSVVLLSIFLSCSQRQSGLFVFDSDERVFTAFAFMNAAGFDGEWRDEGMNPTRTKVREYVQARLDSSFRAIIKEFHFNHNQGSWTGYAPYALQTAGPPDFQMAYDPKTTDGGEELERDYEGLSILLSEFYEKAEIAKLWSEYRMQLQNENEKYEPYALQALSDIIEYCRVNSDFYTRKARQIHFMICPQMSYFTAQTTSINGDIYIIHGPTDSEPSPSAFYHEALHHLVDPLTEEYSDMVNQSKELLALSKERANLGYDQWDDVVNESFVRTIDKVVSGWRLNLSNEVVLSHIIDEYKLGFVLCPYIHEKLSQFEKRDLSFSEFFPEIISGIEIETEKTRWLDFWGSTENDK